MGTLNIEDKKVLNEILAKDENSLTETDKKILRARRIYLNERRQEKYKNVLTDPKPKVKTKKK